MFVPFLEGLKSLREMPVTWALFLIQFAVYIFVMVMQIPSQGFISDLMDDEDFLRIQGVVYSQFVEDHESQYPKVIQDMAEQARLGNSTQSILLGSLGMRDPHFLSEAKSTPFKGDQFQIAQWREKFNLYLLQRSRSPAHQLGVVANEAGMETWITYQFTHSGFLHFAINMWFLLILGALLEPRVGGLFFFSVYILSGVMGAMMFILVSGLSGAPLIGASGAVSGLMALAVALNWKRPARFWYWLLPHPNYTGFVYLPIWVFLGMWVLGDIAGLMSTVNEVGGIAHAAHLGGVLLGLTAASLIGLLGWGKSSAHRIFRNHSRL